jgi:hypothetical protein
MRDGDRSVARPEEELGIEECEWSGYQKSLNAYIDDQELKATVV